MEDAQRKKEFYLEQEVTKKLERERQQFYQECTFKPKINVDKNSVY